MLAQYDTVVGANEVNIPPWSTTWPGYDGCSARGPVYHTGRSYGAPVSQKVWYETSTVSSWRSGQSLIGKAPKSLPFPFVVTPYCIGVKRVWNHLIVRPNFVSGSGVDVYEQYGNVHKVGTVCTPFVDRVEHSGPVYTSYNEQTHQHPYTEYVVNGFDTNEMSNARLSLMDEVSTQALCSYDALTELAEAREIPELIHSSARDLSKMLSNLIRYFGRNTMRRAFRMRPRDLLRHPDRILKDLGNWWMRYRYGVMPLAYSVRDVIKVIHRGQDVRFHSKRVVSPKPTGVSLPPSTTNYRKTEYEGSITYSASIFQHYMWTMAAHFQGVSMNPLVTAWELIPYSFVMDWFVNVGDYIIRRTSSSMAQWNFASISQRDNYTKKTWAHLKADPKTVSYTNVLPVLWYGAAPPTNTSTTIPRPEELQLLSEEVTNSYSRGPFDIHAAQLYYKPNLNWRRLIDSAAMSLNLLRGLITSLR